MSVEKGEDTCQIKEVMLSDLYTTLHMHPDLVPNGVQLNKFLDILKKRRE